MMKSELLSIQTLIQNYFLQRLMQQRKVSYHTVCSYKDAFRLYLRYLEDVHGISATKVSINHFDLEYLQCFCKYLEEKRKNKPVTINNRMAAIKSFMQYVAETAPEYSAIRKRALMLPAQKHELPVMSFITKEFNALIQVCDTNTFIGARDKLMLLLMYNTGVRVSELLEIKVSDIHGADSVNHASVIIHGKGRKQREVPLWKTTVKYINKYLKTYTAECTDYLFINKNGDELTRSGVRTRINKLVSQATAQVPSLREKTVTLHTFRHSVAMNVVISGVDISTIAIWLGHSSIETTHKYMIADIELKRKAMEKVGSAGNSSYKYKPSADIMNFLNSL